MLRSLSIRDIVLIESLDLDFQAGLTVLTGETGAGKSILLDALGFALGHKGRRDLVRAGADKGSVTAVFDLPPGHAAHGLLAEMDLPAGEGELILRRTASADGPSRGFVNDQRASAETLARIGALLVEVHGQHDDRGLLNPRAHRPLLDAFGGLETIVHACRRAWTAWQNAEKALVAERTSLARAAADADFLRHSVDELETFSPQPGEDESLDTERRLIQQSARLTDEIVRAATALSSQGAEGALSDALSRLTHVADRAEGRLDGPIAAIDRTMTELSDAQAGLADVLDALTFDPGRLEIVEERLFALRALARKHDVLPDDLADLTQDMRTRLAAIDAGEDRLAALVAQVQSARSAYDQAASRLSQARTDTSGQLDKAVTRELAPLKMENARFVTAITPTDPGPDGIDQISFTASINPGAAAGPIDRIASGGELSRFLLALKVRLADRGDGLTMIFDEIDRGVGGATADAVGRRLERLAAAGQVLVVTHSPQVAARGQHHWRIAKATRAGTTRSDVTLLGASESIDEIARMLAGDQITDAARAAARALIEAGA